MVTTELKQPQLFAGVFRLRAANHNEASWTGPAVGLIAERSRLDSPTEPAVAQAAQSPLDGRGEPSHDHIARALLLHPVDQLVVEKPFVGAQNHPLALPGNLPEAGLHALQRATRGAHIAGAQSAMQEAAGLRLEAQQRVVGAAPPLEGIVADAGTLLSAVEHQDSRVQIEKQTRRLARASQHAAQEPVVQLAQLRQGDRSDAQQKPAQGGRIGIGAEPGQELESTILSQQFRRLDYVQTGHHRVQQGQQHLPYTVAMVALKDANVLGQGALETDPREKTMQKINAPIMGETGGTELDAKIARAFCHCVQPYFLSRV